MLDTKEQPIERSRAGSEVLTLLARPLHALTLRALGKQPMSLGELLKELGGPSQSTLRGRLGELIEIGAVAKQGGGMPYSVQNELTAVGRDLLQVANALASWLGRAPFEPIPLGSIAAKGALKALAEGWKSRMLSAFAASPLSLTQVNSLIPSISYPALERRLTALRATGLVEAASNGQRVPYSVSSWGREAAGPIAAAAHFEHLHMAERSPTIGDVEGLLLLAIPVAKLTAKADGRCLLIVEEPGDETRRGEVSIAVDRGRIVECAARVESPPSNRAVTDVRGWLRAVVLRDPSPLRVAGERTLADHLVRGVHDAVFSANGGPPA